MAVISARETQVMNAYKRGHYKEDLLTAGMGAG